MAASSGDDHDHLHHKESFKDSGDSVHGIGENVLDDENLADREGAPDEAELSAAMDGIDLGASKEEKVTVSLGPPIVCVCVCVCVHGIVVINFWDFV